MSKTLSRDEVLLVWRHFGGICAPIITVGDDGNSKIRLKVDPEPYVYVVQEDSLTLILLMWRIWWGTNNASRWQMAFTSVFKGLKFVSRKAHLEQEFA